MWWCPYRRIELGLEALEVVPHWYFKNTKTAKLGLSSTKVSAQLVTRVARGALLYKNSEFKVVLLLNETMRDFSRYNSLLLSTTVLCS